MSLEWFSTAVEEPWDNEGSLTSKNKRSTWKPLDRKMVSCMLLKFLHRTFHRSPRGTTKERLRV